MQGSERTLSPPKLSCNIKQKGEKMSDENDSVENYPVVTSASFRSWKRMMLLEQNNGDVQNGAK